MSVKHGLLTNSSDVIEAKQGTSTKHFQHHDQAGLAHHVDKGVDNAQYVMEWIFSILVMLMALGLMIGAMDLLFTPDLNEKGLQDGGLKGMAGVLFVQILVNCVWIIFGYEISNWYPIINYHMRQVMAWTQVFIGLFTAIGFLIIAGNDSVYEIYKMPFQINARVLLSLCLPVNATLLCTFTHSLIELIRSTAKPKYHHRSSGA